MAEKICEKWFYSVGFSFWLEELFFFNLFLYEEQQPSFVCGSVWKD